MALAQIMTNITALKAYQSLNKVNEQLATHQERIASGKKVNRASDSPADFYISSVYSRDIVTLERDIAHTSKASNTLQTAGSKLSQIRSLLEDVEDLAKQAKSDLVTTAEKTALKDEINQLVLEIEDVASGLSDLNALSIGGVNVGAGLTVSVTKTQTGSSDLGVYSSTPGTLFSISTASKVSGALQILNSAISDVLSREEKVGAYISRLEQKTQGKTTDKVNKEAQRSDIRDADLAYEQLQVTKLQIVQQSALAMLAQANMAPSSLLNLLGG